MKSLAIITASCIALAAPAMAHAEDFKAKLIGYEEVPRYPLSPAAIPANATRRISSSTTS